MPLLELLAQQAGSDAGSQGPWWDTPTTRILNYPWPAPPYVAIPIFLVAAGLVMFFVEKLSLLLGQRITSRTATKVDDAFVEGLPGLVRITCVLIAINVTTFALLRQDSHELAGKIVLSIALVVLGVAVARLGLRMLDAWAESKPEARPLIPGISLAVKVGMIPILLISVLSVFSVPVDTFLTALGIGSLAVALALQDVLKNVFAGIQLVMDRPIRAGDFVILSSGVRGTIVDVGLRSTRLRTLDNNLVILPNNTLANEVITNVDLVDNTYTHAITISLDWGSDTRRVEAVLLDETSRATAEIPGFLSEKPQVLFLGPGQLALDFRLVLRLSKYGGHLEPLSELQHRILTRLRAEGIALANPARVLELRGGVRS